MIACVYVEYIEYYYNSDINVSNGIVPEIFILYFKYAKNLLLFYTKEKRDKERSFFGTRLRCFLQQIFALESYFYIRRYTLVRKCQATVKFQTRLGFTTDLRSAQRRVYTPSQKVSRTTLVVSTKCHAKPHGTQTQDHCIGFYAMFSTPHGSFEHIHKSMYTCTLCIG